MKINRSLLIPVLCSLIVACAVSFLSNSGYLKRLELATLDLSFRLRSNLATNPHIVIIEINDSDILGIERWPWRRTWFADMTRVLTELGAKYIYYDMLLSEPSIEEDDNLFEETIKLNKNVYLPFTFLGHSLNFGNTFMPIKRFYSNLKGSGALNVYPDLDGTVRRMPLVFLTDSGLYPHITLKIAMDYLGGEIQDIQSDFLILSTKEDEVKIPLVEKNTMLINWAGGWQNNFKHYTFLKVLTGFKNSLEGKDPGINLNDFKDSICLIAVTAVGLGDIKATPVQPEYPEIGVIANALSNILDRSFLYYPAEWINILLLFILATLPLLLIRGESPFRETIVIIFIGLAYIFLSLFLFFKKSIILNYSSQLLSFFTASFSIGSYNFIRIALERKYFFKMSVIDGLTGLYNIRYFKDILRDELEHAKFDPLRKFCIVMTDIDHFKNFNDKYGHQIGDLVLKEVAVVLKESVRTLDIVTRYGGEEMIILLRGISIRYALDVSEKIRKNVESRLVKDKDNIFKVTISLGVATLQSADTIDTIIKRADAGLYKAKDLGRNRVCSIEKLD